MRYSWEPGLVICPAPIGHPDRGALVGGIEASPGVQLFELPPMQCSGLIDFNGNSVFESDLIKYKNEVLTVEFDPYEACFIAAVDEDQDPRFLSSVVAEASLVGNIHEGPTQ